MLRFNALTLGLALALAGCDSEDPCPSCVDSGPVAEDSGPGDGGAADSGGTDAGPADAGSDRMCEPGPVSPPVFDCATAEPGIELGEPIVADAGTWTWVPFAGARCMNGSSTGIGVRLNPASDRVFILLEGGGACFDPVSCAGVANPDGFDEAKFVSYEGALSRGILDGDDPLNPLADWNVVYVPYCTGDVHGGTNEAGPGGRVHVGYRNISEYLTRLVPTFADASLVLLAGRSAGGLGTLVNYDQVAHAFGCTPVYLLDDAGPLLPDEYLRPCLARQVREAWGLDDAIGDECPWCTCGDGGGLVNVFPYLAARYPERRFGFAIGTADGTFRQFIGYGYSPECNFPQQMPAADFLAGLEGVREALAPHDNFETYYVDTGDHTFTGSFTSTRSAGVLLSEWVRALVDDDAAFTDVGP